MTGATPSRAENVCAAQAALTLGASLIAGIACSMTVRIVLPRVLGPVAYGEYRLVETIAEVVLVILTLGLDTAIRRDVARDPASAGSQLTNILTLRAYGGMALVGAITTGFWLSGADAGRTILLAVLASAQLIVSLNNTHAAVAHGVGDVRWNAVASVVARAAWAALSLTALALAPSPLPVAVAFLVVELARLALQQRRATARYGVRAARPNMPAALTAAAASLPLFVNFLAHNLYGRLGMWWLGATASPAEVGWYGAAANISSAALLGMPLVTWVLLPAAARQEGADTATADRLVAGALRMALLAATPLALLLSALSPTIVSGIFGPSFAPSAATLSLLAPTIALAYGSTVCAVSLIQRGADRAVAGVSVGGLVLSVALNAALVRGGAPGDASASAALAALLTEIVVTAVLARLAWRPAWTAPLSRTVAGILTATAAGAVTAHLTSRYGPVSVAVAAVVYLAALVLTGTVGMPDVRFAQQVLRRGRSRVALAS